MTVSTRSDRLIPVDQLFLNLENFRHGSVDTTMEAIAWLCEHEQVLELAEDIAEFGINPLDRIGVVRDKRERSQRESYTVVEGNRRFCAIKLLVDTDLAPPKVRTQFEQLATKWDSINSIPCVIFEDDTDVDIWLKRRHHGFSGGIGQKEWDATQKARHSGTNSPNRSALEFLDYAESEDLISAESRQRKITTVTRFLSNPSLRRTMGIDVSTDGHLTRDIPKKEFNQMAARFIEDLIDEDSDVNSRQNSASITSYAQSLSETSEYTGNRIPPTPLTPITNKPAAPQKRPKKRARPSRLTQSSEISNALDSLNNQKLIGMYKSICTISLKQHTPLIAIGAWAFLEILTAQVGREPKTDFHSFLSLDRLTKLSLGTKQQIGPIREAIKRIMNYGNTTKHHPVAATYDSNQLSNDMDSIEDVLKKLIGEAIAIDSQSRSG